MASTDIASLMIKVEAEGVKRAEGSLEGLTAASKRAEGQTNKLASSSAKSAKVIKGNFGAMKGATQQLSFQLQDIAVQAQMGTNAFVILGQQGPQIASIFGPGGAVFGVLIALGAMVGGTLMAAFGRAEGGSKSLEEALERLDDQVKRTDNGTLELSKRLLELGKISEAAAMAALVSGMHDARIAIKGSVVAIDELVDGVGHMDLSVVAQGIKELRAEGFTDADFAKPLDSFTEGVGRLGDAVGEVSNQFGISRAQSVAFIEAAGKLKPGDVGAYSDLREVVDGIAASQRDLTPEFAKFLRELVEHESVIRSVSESLEFQKDARRQLAEDGVASLKLLVDGAEEAAKKEATAAELLAEKLIDNNRKVAKSALDRAQTENEAEARKLESMKASANSFLENVTLLGLKEEQLFIEKQARILARLESDYASRLISEQGFIEGKEALNREADNREIEAKKTMMDQWLESTRAGMASMDDEGFAMATSLESNMAGAFSSILAGTASVEDSFKSMAQGLAQSVVSVLAEMAAQWVAYQIVNKLVGKAAMASEVTAMALNAKASVVMAGLNTFASIAAIPIVGPGLAPEAAAAAVAATAPLAATVAVLSSAALAARAVGGQVRGGESYLVGERGPEVLRMGSKGGNITPNGVGVGGGDITIVNNVDASGSGGDVDMKIRKAMEVTSAATVVQIQDLMRRRRFV